MLNKLLKRCMPWMDKGRWYHVHVEGTAETGYTVNHDSIFSRYEIVGGTRKFLHLYFADPNPKKTIIDTKIIPRIKGENYVLNGAYFSVDIVANDTTYLELSLEEVNSLDYWFFIEG